MNLDLSTKLTDIMEQRNIKTLELAKKLDINVHIIKRIQNGELDNPPIITVKKIANHFNLTISKFIGEE